MFFLSKVKRRRYIMKKLFTSESVTPGHPDKLCDQISDNILDAYLKEDPNSRVACEVCAHKNGIVVMGEITSKATINIEKEVRKTIKEIGYFGDTDIDYKKCEEVLLNI
jgi:S-adenosylmethionine synthetase